MVYITLSIFLIIFGYYLKNMIEFNQGLEREYSEFKQEEPLVSVIIAARNEEETIPNLLECLMDQTYPGKKYEIIVANDESEDDTAKKVERFQDEFDKLKLINVDVPKGVKSRKKNALSQAMEVSKGSIILSTDADCIVKNTWIEGMVKYFVEGVGLVAGLSLPEYENSGNFIEKFDCFDMLAMFTAAAGTIGIDRPFSCSGQNIAFTRQAFQEVDGYETIKEYESGDDVLLMQLIDNAGYNIRFAFDQGTFNSTTPQKTLLDFLNQRVRWATNEKPQSFLNKDFYIFLINALMLNLILLGTLFFIPTLFIIFLFLKSVVEFWIINKGRKTFKKSSKIMYFFPIWEISYPIYAVITAIGEKLEVFEWKT